MKSISRFFAEPHPCHYLSGRNAYMEYEAVAEISRKELGERIEQGWRRQGYLLFRPVCQTCHACQPIRVVVDQFQPDRSQRRVIKANQNVILKIGRPNVAMDRVDLYVKHHEHHAVQKGWRRCNLITAANRIGIFMSAVTDIEEWAYYLDGKLVAVSYIDVLEQGFSGVYFYHHPDYRKNSLGTWCVLSLIQRASDLSLPYVYLGYYVGGCRSMEYKGRFAPAEVLSIDGQWLPFSAPAP